MVDNERHYVASWLEDVVDGVVIAVIEGVLELLRRLGFVVFEVAGAAA